MLHRKWLKVRRGLRQGYWLHFPFQIVTAWLCYHWYFHTPIPKQSGARHYGAVYRHGTCEHAHMAENHLPVFDFMLGED